MLEKLSASTFEPLTEQAFKLEHETWPDDVEARLIEVHPMSESAAESSGRASFSLLFACPNLDETLQAVFRLKHDITGELDVFLVPVGRDERGLLLEAVFN
ncbi:MAG: hypothetical protein AAF446_07065 [Pseudomonadota bacterium]